MKCSVRSTRTAGAALQRLAGLALFAAALVGCVAVTAADAPADKADRAAEPPTMMSDPLLGLRYDTTKIAFERLPAAIAKKADLGASPQWIYARSESGGATLYVVSGFLRIEGDDPDARESAVEPDVGAVLRSSGGKVDVLGVPDRLYGDDAIVAPEQLKPLLADAVTRYVAAWGGKDSLQAALLDFEQPDIVPIALREALRVHHLHVGGAGAR